MTNLPACLSASVCLSSYLSVCLTDFLSACLLTCLSVWLRACLTVCLSSYLVVCLLTGEGAPVVLQRATIDQDQLLSQVRPSSFSLYLFLAPSLPFILCLSTFHPFSPYLSLFLSFTSFFLPFSVTPSGLMVTHLPPPPPRWMRCAQPTSLQTCHFGWVRM